MAPFSPHLSTHTKSIQLSYPKGRLLNGTDFHRTGKYPFKFSGPVHTLGAEFRYVQKSPLASIILQVSELTWIKLGHGLLCQKESPLAKW